MAVLREKGAPAITVIGLAWVIYMLNASKRDVSKLDAKLSSSIAGLDAKLSSSIAGLDVKVSALAVDVKSIKGNHLPHIEAAIKALAKGTPNEEHVKTILDLSREVELRTADTESKDD
jgi:hypothetical protein